MKTPLTLIPICIVAICMSCNSNKTAETTISSDNMSTTVSDTSKMKIIAKVTVKAEKCADFTEAAREIIEKSNLEAGCTSYQLYQDPYDTTKFVFVEEYKNQAAVDAHFAAEYFQAFGTKIGDMVAGAPEIKVVTVAKEVLK